jgi:hypothetical protein
MNQFTPDIVQDKDKKFARRKAKPTHQMQLEANDVGSIDNQKIQGSGGTNQLP